MDGKAIHELQKYFWRLAHQLERYRSELGGHLLRFGQRIDLPQGRISPK